MSYYEINDNNYQFISDTNEQTNHINKLIYTLIHNKKCPKCLNEISINSHYFCRNCIKFFEFKCGKNKKFDNIKPDTYAQMTENKNQYTIFRNEKYDGELLKAKSNMIFCDKKSQQTLYLKYDTDNKHLLFNGENICIELTQLQLFVKIPIYKIYNRKENVKQNIRYITEDTLNQLNLKLSLCITTHKAQGQTMKRICVVLDKGFVKSNLLFTALTRAQEIDDTKILHCQKEVIFGRSEFYEKCETTLPTIIKINPDAKKLNILLEKHNHKLSTYDIVFLTNIKNNYINNNKSLSNKQQNHLNNLYTQHK